MAGSPSAKTRFALIPGHDEPPDGQISNSLSTPISKNICVPLQSKSLHESRRPVPIEGRLAIVTNAGRDAVDA